jgi:hypothetical protein
MEANASAGSPFPSLLRVWLCRSACATREAGNSRLGRLVWSSMPSRPPSGLASALPPGTMSRAPAPAAPDRKVRRDTDMRQGSSSGGEGGVPADFDGAAADPAWAGEQAVNAVCTPRRVWRGSPPPAPAQTARWPRAYSPAIRPFGAISEETPVVRRRASAPAVLTALLLAAGVGPAVGAAGQPVSSAPVTCPAGTVLKTGTTGARAFEGWRTPSGPSRRAACPLSGCASSPTRRWPPCRPARTR